MISEASDALTPLFDSNKRICRKCFFFSTRLHFHKLCTNLQVWRLLLNNSMTSKQLLTIDFQGIVAMDLKNSTNLYINPIHCHITKSYLNLNIHAIHCFKDAKFHSKKIKQNMKNRIWPLKFSVFVNCWHLLNSFWVKIYFLFS